MIIGGLQKLSLIDYPSKLAAVVFTVGCNFRCPYCHNPMLVRGRGERHLAEADIFEYLAKRVGMLGGVVITGGEPTLHDDLGDFIRPIKRLGYAIKLDTNGSRPQMLRSLLDDDLVDFIAMDIKAPLERYHQVTRLPVNIEAIRESMDIITGADVPFQFRTTLARPLLDYSDAAKIQKLIDPWPLHIQECRTGNVLDESFNACPQYTAEEIDELKTQLQDNAVIIEQRISAAS